MGERKIYISLGVVCLFLGLIMTIQFRATSANPSINGLYRVPELTSRLSEVSRERDLLVSEVVALRKQQLQSGNVGSEVVKVALVSGQLPGHGPGLRITIEDSPVTISDNPNDYIVHYSDLQYLINDLRLGDAEAIAINGERISASTALTCAGPTILVNLSRIAPPYVIDCVGDQQKMEAVLNFPAVGFLNYISGTGIKVKVTRMNDITIPASKTPINLQYLQPVKK